MKSIWNEAHALKDSLISCRRRLHALAECGFSLSKTTSFVKNTLQNIGYDPRGCGKGGVVCDLPSSLPGAPTVLLRADMDALPLKEETRLPFRAENGHMHACGHDMHTAMLLGAASLLKSREGSLPVSVRFAFEGAEETLSGARDLYDAGILSGVLSALMLHVVTSVPFPTGTVLLPPEGIGAPAACFFEIEIYGKSAHVGAAHEGQDALTSAIKLYSAMQEEKARMGEDFFLSIGKWQAGDAPNIVPQHALLAGSFRARDEEKVTAFQKKLLSLCARSDTKTHIRYLGACPPLKNNGECISLLSRALPAYGFSVTQAAKSEGNAAEDFAVLASACPSVALALAAGEKEHGYDYPLHHPKVLFDEDALPVGAALYAAGALTLGEGMRLQTFTKDKGA